MMSATETCAGSAGNAIAREEVAALFWEQVLLRGRVERVVGPRAGLIADGLAEAGLRDR